MPNDASIASVSFVTDYGTVEITAVNEESLVITTPMDSPITINRVPIRMRVEVKRVSENDHRNQIIPGWVVNYWTSERSDWLRRNGSYYASTSISDSARNKIRNEIIPQAIEMAERMRLTEFGRIEARNREIAGLDREIRELNEKLTERLTKRAELLLERAEESRG